MVFGYNRLVIHQILGTETGHPEDNAMNWQNGHNITKLHIHILHINMLMIAH